MTFSIAGVVLLAVLALLAVGIYGLLAVRNLIKVIVALQILAKGAVLALVLGGLVEAAPGQAAQTPQQRYRAPIVVAPETYEGVEGQPIEIGRLGDLAAAFVVFAGTSWLALEARGFAVIAAHDGASALQHMQFNNGSFTAVKDASSATPSAIRSVTARPPDSKRARWESSAARAGAARSRSRRRSRSSVESESWSVASASRFSTSLR